MTATRSWTAWSCTVRLTVEDPLALERGCRDLKALMDRVDRAASRFRPDSELSRFNRHAGLMIPVSPLFAELIDVSLTAAEQTGGAVDPTVGAALIAAGYDTDITTLRTRTPATTPAAMPTPLTPPPARAGGVEGWRRVRRTGWLGLAGVPKGVQLDLGATAKAWTADRAATEISARYGCAVLVELGGDLRAAGRPDAPWQLDVAEREGGPGTRVALRYGGLTTSTRTVRRWLTPYGEGHHVIDPRTGRPATGPWRTATVWAPTALLANTFSTAIVATGDPAVARLRLAAHPARLVDTDGTVRDIGAWPSAPTVPSGPSGVSESAASVRSWLSGRRAA